MLPKDFVFNSVYKEAKKRGGRQKFTLISAQQWRFKNF